MAADGKKGITVKVDAALHAEITQYLQDHGMTMTEFVTLALQDELHPKIDEKEGKNMEKMRTLAFQVPESLFQRIKDYLARLKSGKWEPTSEAAANAIPELWVNDKAAK